MKRKPSYSYPAPLQAVLCSNQNVNLLPIETKRVLTGPSKTGTRLIKNLAKVLANSE